MSALVRDATAQDFKAVLDLGTVYKGLDYLPYFYHDYIADPDYIVNVCEVDGQIVGYQQVLKHDGGRIAQGKSRRVKTTHRRRGYNKAMEKYFRNILRKETQIEYFWATYPTDTIDWNEVQENPKMQHVLTQKLYHFKIPHQTSNHFHPSYMKCLNKTQLEDVLDCRPLRQKLFPHGLIQAGFLSLGLDKRNIRHIINSNTSVFAKVPTGSNDIRPESIKSLSVGIRYWSPAGHVCQISYFGKENEDYHDHIHAQIEVISQSDFIIVGLLVPQFFPENILNDIYLKFGQKDGEMLHSETLSLIQTDLRQNTVKSKI